MPPLQDLYVLFKRSSLLPPGSSLLSSRIRNPVPVTNHRATQTLLLPSRCSKTAMASPSSMKTRILIISDTHGVKPSVEDDSKSNSESGSLSSSVSAPWKISVRDTTANADADLVLVNGFCQPLPKADVAIHCGDLTRIGGLADFKTTFTMMREINAPLKLMIPGNHDLCLDPDYWIQWLRWETEGPQKNIKKQRTAQVRQLAEASQADGVFLLDEGSYDFVLDNGARLKVFASPLTPSWGGWPFQYQVPHKFDIPSGVDVAMTHGPPFGILDFTRAGSHGGCRNLLESVSNARPRIHCFGHIHEAWGAKLVSWDVLSPEGQPPVARVNEENSVLIDNLETLEGTKADNKETREAKVAVRNEWADCRCRAVSLCGGHGTALEHGKQTLFVNAAIVAIGNQPRQLPWLVELELPQATDGDIEKALETLETLKRTAQEASNATTLSWASEAPSIP